MGELVKKVGDIFQELGFNADASDDVKIAFIKNLVKAAYGADIPGPKKLKTVNAPKAIDQLSFDFDCDLKKAN